MRRCIIAFFAAYVFLFVWGWLINSVLLKDIYTESGSQLCASDFVR